MGNSLKIYFLCRFKAPFRSTSKGQRGAIGLIYITVLGAIASISTVAYLKGIQAQVALEHHNLRFNNSIQYLKLSMENSMSGGVCTFMMRGRRLDSQLTALNVISISGQRPVYSVGQTIDGLRIAQMRLRGYRAVPNIVNARIVDVVITVTGYDRESDIVIPILANANSIGSIQECLGTYYQADGRTVFYESICSSGGQQYDAQNNSCTGTAVEEEDESSTLVSGT